MTKYPMTKLEKADEVFTLHEPESQFFPVIFNSPHSGRNYPPSFIEASALNTKSLRASEDFYIDRLFSGVCDLGCPLLQANFPRAFLDSNRQAWELDPKMFSDQLPDYAKTSGLRISAGLGTIAKKVSENREIYREKLTFKQAKLRIETFYFPYHRKIRHLMQKTKARFGQVLLIDCHSMPSSSTWSANRKKSAPDIVLGDCFGSSSSRQFVELLEQAFKDNGFNVARNYPYAGGYITKTYGKPLTGAHVIQVEINRGLYMNENKLCLHSDFEVFQHKIEVAISTFLATAPFNRADQTIAAE